MVLNHGSIRCVTLDKLHNLLCLTFFMYENSCLLRLLSVLNGIICSMYGDVPDFHQFSLIFTFFTVERQGLHFPKSFSDKLLNYSLPQRSPGLRFQWEVKGTHFSLLAVAGRGVNYGRCEMGSLADALPQTTHFSPAVIWVQQLTPSWTSSVPCLLLQALPCDSRASKCWELIQ